MSIQEENFWAATVDSPPVAASSELPDSVEVAVVGGGYCGLSAARTLAKRGVNVAVFEAETFVGAPAPVTAAWSYRHEAAGADTDQTLWHRSRPQNVFGVA